MAKRILGLEIGNSNIKLLECVQKKGGRLIIEKAERVPTPEGAISDGIIHDVEKVYEAIYTELKNNRYKAKNIMAIIKSSEIITRDIRMDAMPKKDMDVILKLQYQEYLLVDISQYQVTYKVVRELLDTEQKQQELLIVAAPNTVIFPLLELADKLKMRMRSINIASDAITNLFSNDNQITYPRDQDIMIIDIGGESTTATIISEGVGVLNRDIPFGMDAINSLMIREFNSKNLDNIDKFKEKYLVIYLNDNELDEYGQYINSMIKQMLEYQLVSEIKRLLQFHFSRSKNNSIHKVHIIGGGAYLKNIDKYLTNILDIQCISGIKLDLVQVEFDEEFEKQSAYFANILGLITEF